ncbi:hydrogenase, partial [Desulfococcaceae bacterium OttesenSCG-928-F15]|nr:hydrogenase [Desulfococcaceae bacterium OttesenSCG-928-F15]
MDNFMQIWNGQCIPRKDIPRVAFADFYKIMAAFTGNSGYIVQFFVHEEEEKFVLTSVVRNSGLYLLSTEIEDSYPSLTMHAGAKFNLFEREIAEQYGIRPIGHPWLKMVRYHANQTGRPDLFGNDYSEDIPGNYEYFKVHGDAIHEVGVGPVHAGIIEPGHFRFQCAGEEVLHL